MVIATKSWEDDAVAFPGAELYQVEGDNGCTT